MKFLLIIISTFGSGWQAGTVSVSTEVTSEAECRRVFKEYKRTYPLGPGLIGPTHQHSMQCIKVK